MSEESVADFARREGISARRVRALISDGSLTARQVGRQWLIDQASVRHPAPSRPLGTRMQANILNALSGDALRPVSASERYRLRAYLDSLKGASEPERILAGWIPQRPPLKLAAASSDLDDLALDARFVKTGFSDPRTQIAAAGQLEGRVAAADVESLRREFLLRPSERPNVIVHVVDERPSSPVPLGLLLVDLAHHEGVRERSRVVELIRGTAH